MFYVSISSMEPNAVPPGEILRQKLKGRGWTQEDLALVLGRSLGSVSDLIRGKSGITPEFAVALAAALNENPAEWLSYDLNYKLALTKTDTSQIRQRADLFTDAPIREMQKRGWLSATEDLAAVKAELSEFRKKGRAYSPVHLRHSSRQAGLTPSEDAWCDRARALARTLLVTKPFSPSGAKKTRNSLRKLATHPKEARFIAELLAESGVRFLVVEPLSGVRIDGATFWDEFGPVIALSMRFDRMDWFWFTLMHEWSHVEHQDPNSVDTDLVGEQTAETERDVVENRANSEAASSLIPSEELTSFIRRVGPLYSKVRIVQLANRLKIHPAIIVGQLQHARELGWSTSLREFLVKVREIVISTTLTDGWGHIISSTSMGGRSTE